MSFALIPFWGVRGASRAYSFATLIISRASPSCSGVELQFKGSKVIARFKVLGMYGDPIEGTFKVKGDEITITFPDGDKDTKDLSGTHSFEKGDGYVKIGIVTYKEVK